MLRNLDQVLEDVEVYVVFKQGVCFLFQGVKDIIVGKLVDFFFLVYDSIQWKESFRGDRILNLYGFCRYSF